MDKTVKNVTKEAIETIVEYKESLGTKSDFIYSEKELEQIVADKIKEDAKADKERKIEAEIEEKSRLEEIRDNILNESDNLKVKSRLRFFSALVKEGYSSEKIDEYLYIDNKTYEEIEEKIKREKRNILESVLIDLAFVLIGAFIYAAYKSNNEVTMQFIICYVIAYGLVCIFLKTMICAVYEDLYVLLSLGIIDSYKKSKQRKVEVEKLKEKLGLTKVQD